ncbi:hypothetical protein [Sorangium sp. So ce1024]|uniref:hypothetical protein n=1 Tax=Sorangium sp. So ce1024 TaxID=3133327 RepID=UPI003F1259FA
MTMEVAIARVSLRVRGVPGRPSSADAFVEAVLSALERRLDALPDLPEVVVLPRLSVDLRVAVPAGASPADAIARALADAIAQAAFCAPVPAPTAASVDRSPALARVPAALARVPAARARLLHAAAQAARAGQPSGAVAALLGRATAPVEGLDRRPELDAATPSPALVPGAEGDSGPRWAAVAQVSPGAARCSPRALVAAVLHAPRPLMLLGRLARARLLGCLAEALVQAAGAGVTGGAGAAGPSWGAGPSAGAASPAAPRAPGAAAALSLLRRVVEELADRGGGHDEPPGAPPPCASLCEAAMARIEAARARALRAIAWAGEALAAPVQLVLALAELSRTGRGALARSRTWRAAVLAAITRRGLDALDPPDPAALDAAVDPGPRAAVPGAGAGGAAVLAAIARRGLDALDPPDPAAIDPGPRAAVPGAGAGGAAGSFTPAETGEEAPSGRGASPVEAALGGARPPASGVDEDRGGADGERGPVSGAAITTDRAAAPGAGRVGSSRADRASAGARGEPHALPAPGVGPRAPSVAADGPRRGTRILAARPLADLGRLARRGLLPELVEQLDEPTARALLGGIHAELLAAGPRLAAQPRAASALRAAEARALRAAHASLAAGGVDATDDRAPGAISGSEADGPAPVAGPAHLPPAVKLVLAIAELCRATPAALLNAPSLRGQALAAIEHLVGAASTSSVTASTALPAASDPRQTASDPRQTASDPRQTASDPRQTASDPRQTASDPRQTASDPRQTASDPRQTASDPRQTASDPRQTASDPPYPPLRTQCLRQRARPPPSLRARQQRPLPRPPRPLHAPPPAAPRWSSRLSRPRTRRSSPGLPASPSSFAR